MKNLLNLIILAAAFICITTASFAQEASRQKTVKLYSNISLQNNVNTWDTTRFSHTEMRVYFTPAITIITSSGNFHEIEFSSAKFTSRKIETTIVDRNGMVWDISGGTMRNADVALRYEYNMLIYGLPDDGALRAYLGMGVSPSFSHTTFIPGTSLSFPWFNNNLGLNLFITPRITYSITEKWFLDLNVPINFAGINLNYNRVENPQWALDQQRRTTLTTTALTNSYLARLGLGVKI